MAMGGFGAEQVGQNLHGRALALQAGGTRAGLLRGLLRKLSQRRASHPT